jgi:hypothetical protein
VRDADPVADPRHALAAVVADLLRRAAMAAVNRLHQLAEVQVTPALTPLLGVICQDHLLLVEPRPPRDLTQLRTYLQLRYRQSADALVTANQRVLARLGELVARQPEVGNLLRLAVGSSLKLERAESLLEPRLLDAIRNAGLAGTLHLSVVQMDLLRDLGLRLKSFELLAALRRRILPMQRQAGALTLAGPSSATPIARTTRPYDFTAPGVVDSAVRRFGLIYDLSNFTAVLEEMRKEGRMAEERALQFMYVFQNRLEAIRLRRRLTFEKFLGDGAFYTSRRALRVIAAACEIQSVYEQLRGIGFPFNHGIRIALNFGVYRLLPMLHPGPEAKRFEFFGHGIVELARLTTGKSAREVSDIAEFLIHSGYEPRAVESFLAPLSSVRSGLEQHASRRYAATIDGHGELINEGIVVAFPFLEELQHELELEELAVVENDSLQWLLLPIDPALPDTLYVGLRHLGVARLKGLPPQELAEAVVWRQRPPEAAAVPFEGSLIEPPARPFRISDFGFRISTHPPAEHAAVQVHGVNSFRGSGSGSGSCSGRSQWQRQWTATAPDHSTQRHRGWKSLQVVQTHPPEVEPPRHQGTKMFTKRILGVFLGVLVPSWLRRFALTPRKATVSGYGRLGLAMPRSRRLLAAPVAATDAAL